MMDLLEQTIDLFEYFAGDSDETEDEGIRVAKIARITRMTYFYSQRADIFELFDDAPSLQ